MTHLIINGSSASKLSLNNILEIGHQSINEADPVTVEDLVWVFLRRLMALNKEARNTQYTGSSENIPNQDTFEEFDFYNDDEKAFNPTESMHPLDVLCAVLHKSNPVLQQEITSKMSMCQFAIPLLLPAGDGPGCTFMLWALRDIVKRWRPHSLAESKGFKEDSVVNISMPIFSFVRLGQNKMSKSKILNQVLSPPQQGHSFFIHDNMERGNIKKMVSNGLVEISWYFPIGKETYDIFPEPTGVTNLRGNLESNWVQFQFQMQVSSAVFIFAENMSENDYRLLSSCKHFETTVCFIINPSADKSLNKESLGFLKRLAHELNINPTHIISKERINETQVVKRLQKTMSHLIKNSCKRVKLNDISDEAKKLGIHVDEGSKEFQISKEMAVEITKEIGDVVEYKRENMKLQGQLWKELSQLEKEFCRMKKLGHQNAEDYRCQLKQRRSELHQEQHKHDLPDGMNKFISAMTQLTHTDRVYFLKWMKFTLDSISRDVLSTLHSKYSQIYSEGKSNLTGLKKIDTLMCNSSLGLEHFLRELGQFYESECSLIRDKLINVNQRKFSRLPEIAAKLLLDGFPLELIDGDASNIPIQWITDILTELDTMTGKGCKLRVISVLGVQSTGKSTLLNTMFGLQFPVASGRCTRGAFMTLIKVKQDFREELGCDFILVIDTEGLKAPERGSLDNSYEHDNELATVVVGLSDITIINMAMENIVEMSDTLQIVAHAFLRMNEIGKKPICQFVHHNCSEVSAHEMTIRDRVKMVEQLNEMTKVAAKMEKKSGITAFSDIMTYNHEKDNWYIPGLWYGVPPMASVNTGYSENVYSLKKHLFNLMAQHKDIQNSQSINELIIWIKSLWNAVKHEKFIFAFKNSLVAEAYDKLAVKYSEWEWNFRKKIHTWITNVEMKIKNEAADEIHPDIDVTLKNEVLDIFQKEELKMLKLIEDYYKSATENVYLIERYREEFLVCVKCLRQELSDSASNKIEEIIRRKNSNDQFQAVQSKYQKVIEDKVSNLVEKCRQNKNIVNREANEKMFETLWSKAISELPKCHIDKLNISQEMLGHLTKDMENKGAVINEKLLNIKNLTEYGKQTFQMDKNYIAFNRNPLVTFREYWTNNSHNKIYELARFLVRTCNEYVTEQISKNTGYDNMYSHELLNIINKKLREKDVMKLPTTHLFDMELKLHILGSAALRFQEMHDKFVQENDPKRCLEKLKPYYLTSLKNIFCQEKDETQGKAKQFCELCLKPALMEHIDKHIGKAIIDDIYYSGKFKEFSSSRHFQFAVLKNLLENEDFHQYLHYINRYEKFVKSWITKKIQEKYEKSKELDTLQIKILSRICKKIKEVLIELSSVGFLTASDFLQAFCNKLRHDLVISQSNILVTIFQIKDDVQMFSDGIELYVTETEKQISSEIKSSSNESVLSRATLNPMNEVFKSVCGCLKFCPFCKVPCEASGRDHEKHFASIHRPKGLAKGTWQTNASLTTSICSTAVDTDLLFVSPETNWEPHPYKEYQTIYQDWIIQPTDIRESSEYWKYIFKEFNRQFAAAYVAETAKLAEDWKDTTAEEALRSLEEAYSMT
ncbi:up-regulator of cell proliferation [Xenopus laevis]|uniref:Up-regulator of cell proliferation n=1 Tax=Xenopus laevis TaxID=8355 RepID=A0A8J0U3F9_XENLA|nr:up-regulator of cell proliferation [Xenopus laevis]